MPSDLASSKPPAEDPKTLDFAAKHVAPADRDDHTGTAESLASLLKRLGPPPDDVRLRWTEAANRLYDAHDLPSEAGDWDEDRWPGIDRWLVEADGFLRKRETSSPVNPDADSRSSDPQKIETPIRSEENTDSATPDEPCFEGSNIDSSNPYPLGRTKRKSGKRLLVPIALAAVVGVTLAAWWFRSPVQQVASTPSSSVVGPSPDGFDADGTTPKLLREPELDGEERSDDGLFTMEQWIQSGGKNESENADGAEARLKSEQAGDAGMTITENEASDPIQTTELPNPTETSEPAAKGTPISVSTRDTESRSRQHFVDGIGWDLQSEWRLLDGLHPKAVEIVELSADPLRWRSATSPQSSNHREADPSSETLLGEIDDENDTTLATVVLRDESIFLKPSQAKFPEAFHRAITNGRLIVNDQTVLFRESLQSDAIVFDTGNAEMIPEWDLGMTPELAESEVQIDFRPPETTELRWAESPTRAVRQTFVATLTPEGEDETVELGFRGDLIVGRRVKLRIRLAARLDPAVAWSPVSRPIFANWARQWTDAAQGVDLESKRLSEVERVAYRIAGFRGEKIIRDKQQLNDRRKDWVAEGLRRIELLDGMLNSLQEDGSLHLEISRRWEKTPQTILRVGDPVTRSR